MDKHGDGIWIIDTASRTTYANEQMGNILGCRASELIGQPSFDYVFPEDKERARILFEAKAAGDTKPFRFKLRRKDGSAVWVHVQGTPMFNAAGTFKGIVGTFTMVDEPSKSRPT